MDISTLTFNQRDEFARRDIAVKTISLLASDIEVSPLIIDGDWGTGKSEFCHKLINLMKESHTEYQLIYVDAYKADHVDEPLLTLLAEIMKLVPKGLQQKSFFKKILPTLKFGLKSGGKGVIGHLLKQDFADVADDFDDFDKEIKQVSDKIIDSSIESLLKGHLEASKNLHTLQSALTELTKENPITIFIDELDRCRPDYAVAILETIKHVFDVENVQFVLVTNSTQLRASINHCYGGEVNAQRYLNKFVGFSFVLPEVIQSHNNQLVAITHYVNLIRSSKALKTSKLDQGASVKFIENLIQVNNWSLREIETCVKHLEIYQVLTGSYAFENLGNNILTLLGVAIFCFNPEQKRKLTKGLIDGKFLTSFIGCYELYQWENGAKGPTINETIAAVIANESSDKIQEFEPNSETVAANYEERFQGAFKDGHFSIDTGQRLSITREAINTLSFANG
jgi:predicted KAP-like P-loop ATPase